jgi:hypothetical protein
MSKKTRDAAAETVNALRALAIDRERKAQKQRLDTLQDRYDEALRTIERLERERAASGLLSEPIDTFTIEPNASSRTAEGTVVWVASDWHVEERVGPEVGTLNRYTPAIARARATQFFQHGLRLTRLLAQDIKVNALVVALLGDFISNDIHEAESAEMNALQPGHALMLAQELLVSGFEFLLKHSDVPKIIVPCHSGNHGRTTKKTRFSAENGHSLEYLLYRHIATHFRDEPRLTFVIPDGYHSYLDVYGTTIRFHHGHAIKYQGGVGGIYIPTLKALAQWDRARRADLDVFGHFHQLRDGGKFISNGSLIGYNGFALSIKADYEKPKQALFLVDKKRGFTARWPILFDI